MMRDGSVSVFVYLSLCVCVCVCERERERERERDRERERERERERRGVHQRQPPRANATQQLQPANIHRLYQSGLRRNYPRGTQI
jgi:hypothetical protein